MTKNVSILRVINSILGKTFAFTSLNELLRRWQFGGNILKLKGVVTVGPEISFSDDPPLKELTEKLP